MWPLRIDWKALKFCVEIEFVGGLPEGLELLPGWTLSLDERQLDEDGTESGGELRTPPITWKEREQIRTMLSRLRERGARSNWGCGLHVHVDLQPWGAEIIFPLAKTALFSQEALRDLLQTSEHRLLYCPPVTERMLERYRKNPDRAAFHRPGRPQSHRCGINVAAWFDIGTVEIRYANGSLDYGEVMRATECCLRFVAAVGAGARLPDSPLELASAIGAPLSGYPPAKLAPQWYRERIWLEDLLIPVIEPLVQKRVPGGDIHHVTPAPKGLKVAAETPDGNMTVFTIRPTQTGWEFSEDDSGGGTPMRDGG